MHRESSVSFYSDSCPHKESVISDGTEVCIDCAKVVDSRVLTHFQQNEIAKITDVSLDFLIDVCSRGHVPRAILEYTLILKKEFKAQLHKNKINENDLTMFSLYEALIRHKIPRRTEEIYSISGVTPSTLCAIQRQLSMNDIEMPNPALAEDYISRFCSLLNIGYFASSEIKNLLAKVYSELGHVRAHCLAAFVIYVYCREKKIKRSTKIICEMCGASSAVIYKLYNSYKCKKIEYL